LGNIGEENLVTIARGGQKNTTTGPGVGVRVYLERGGRERNKQRKKVYARKIWTYWQSRLLIYRKNEGAAL